MVFVRGAPNLQFANPRDIPQRYSAVIQGSETVEVASQPDDISEHTYSINFGESISSLRPLLRRASRIDHMMLSNTVATTDIFGEINLNLKRMPPPPGYYTNGLFTAKGVEVTGTDYNYNYTACSPIYWIAQAFVAMRGSTRWHLNCSNTGGNVPDTMWVHRSASSTGSHTTLRYNMGSTAGNNASHVAWGLLNIDSSNGASGAFLTNSQMQRGISFETPFVSQYRFMYANPSYWMSGITDDNSDIDNYRVRGTITPTTGSYGNITLTRYWSIGTDFTLHFFLNTPQIWYNSNSGNTPG
jgi:hypothetical protein